MDNEERIRKWRQGRARDRDLAVDLLDDPADDLTSARGERRQVTGEAIGSTPRLPSDVEVEDARLAIVRRRRLRWRQILRRTALFVLLPLLAVLFYAMFIATKLYQGEAIFTVQTSAQAAPSPTAGLFAVGGSNSTIADAFKAREFILSRPMMNYMERRHGLLSHFASSDMDPLTRFRSPLGLNRDAYHYYLDRVRVAVDVQEGILRLYVQARTPEDAVRFGNAILSAAEQNVRRFSDKITEDQISSLTRDVQNAERQVADTRRSLAAVQARRGELAPEQAVAGIYQLISSLEVQRAEAQRERDSLLSQGLTESPLLPKLDARLQELNSQISAQRRRLVSPSDGSLQRTLNDFESASARKEIAQARWESTMSTLQQAYLRILEQRRYFVVIVGMSVDAFPKVRNVLALVWPILLLLAAVYALVLAMNRARLHGPGSSGGWKAWRRGRAWRRT